MDAGQWAGARRLLRQVQEQEPGYREMEQLRANTESELERGQQQLAERLPNSPERNPQGPSSGDLRAKRGGSWGDGRLEVRSAVRHNYSPSDSDSAIGFRCACSET
jgi:formylglycine-generating enzyme required for sulfatase activity